MQEPVDLKNEFSVVMPVHQLSDSLTELTKNAIASLGKIKELIIVDDASPVGGGYLRHEADIYIRNKENLGYAASVNRGLKLATGKYIAVVNNDIRISPNWQEVAKEVFITPQIYSCHYRMTGYEEPFKYGDKIAYSGKERWCHASFFVINTEAATLFYDEEYKNTVDDWDYWHSVRMMGLKQAYTDKAQFQHMDGATIPRMEGHTERNKANYEYFKEKWGEYPEDLFAKQFPDQMNIPYWDGFKI